MHGNSDNQATSQVYTQACVCLQLHGPIGITSRWEEPPGPTICTNLVARSRDSTYPWFSNPEGSGSQCPHQLLCHPLSPPTCPEIAMTQT